MNPVRVELAKLILVGTRITYQATGDAGYSDRKWLPKNCCIVPPLYTL